MFRLDKYSCHPQATQGHANNAGTYAGHAVMRVTSRGLSDRVVKSDSLEPTQHSGYDCDVSPGSYVFQGRARLTLARMGSALTEHITKTGWDLTRYWTGNSLRSTTVRLRRLALQRIEGSGEFVNPLMSLRSPWGTAT